MRAILFLLLTSLVFSYPSMETQQQQQWSSFKIRYKKVYGSQIEENYHQSCFYGNLQEITKKNANRYGVTYGITKFADLCLDDFKRLLTFTAPPKGRKMKPAPIYSQDEVAMVVPFDWRKKGAVTNVKDEGQCGSTWAFSAAENMEGQWFIAGHGLYNLSVQELVSCVRNGSQGCQGGLMTDGQQYAIDHGITSADNYPYTSGSGSSGTCEPKKVKQPVAKFRSIIEYFQGEEQMLTWTSKNGPLSVAIDASNLALYTGGIIQGEICTNEIDHAIVMVGYGIEPNGTSYWIAKNQWGTDWGEKGYLRLRYGQNTCNLTVIPSSALV